MALSILIIEKNEQIRELVGRHLGASNFEVTGVGDGLAAAKQLRQKQADLIIIDEDVPMGGIKTARVLRLHPDYQQIPIVLTLSSDSEVKSLVEEGKKINLDSVMIKPYSGSTLEQKVNESLKTQLAEISVKDMREELEQLTNLPVLQPAHRKMLSLLSMEDDQVDVAELIRTIQTDQGLTTEILRTCHSAFYGYRGNSIEGATTFLGIDQIRKIVQASIIFDVFDVAAESGAANGFSVLELWKHCIACGLIMEEGGHRVKGRDHFIAGMLHDIGKIVLYLRFRDHFEEILRITEAENKTMYQVERELLGIAHTDIGYELARKWDLPPTIATSIAFHHNLPMALQHRRLTYLVHLSDILTRKMEIGHPGDSQTLTMDPGARSLAKFVFSVADKKEAIRAEVESVVQMGGKGI